MVLPTKLPDSPLSHIAPSAAVASRHVATKSVLNPLLWLSGIISPAAMIVALFATAPLLYVLLGLAVLPPLAAVIAYVAFAFIEPNRLQSEEYLLQQQWLAAQIGDNTTKQVITLEGESAAPSANTAMIGMESDG